MPTTTQTGQPLRLTTALGEDRLLIAGFEGTESISKLYSFTLDLKGELDAGDFSFEDILGKPATIEIDVEEGEGTRYIHGIISWFSQGERGKLLGNYRAELVPKAWLLTCIERSRTFQHVSVPEILEEVFVGLDIDLGGIQGTFEPRDYCVQYRESDWNFACRLMEDEGIYYFFKHEETTTTLVLANTPQGHPDVPPPNEIIYRAERGGHHQGGRITSWEKVQEVVTGKVTLWDHCFEMPKQNFEAIASIPSTVSVGTKTHSLTAGDAGKLEDYDYPGGYAGRFDGIDRGGGDQASGLSKIFEDNKRTVAIRMQQTAVQAVRIYAGSDCPQLTSGHKFQLKEHFDADGSYVVTHIEHSAVLDNYRTEGAPFTYSNTFECIPEALPFRPERVTKKSIMRGTQTATVVGPAGEEIFTDKYGRVKVQFHWDREGQQDAESSCWLRVATPWAGSNWGMIHIPRIGQEVVVDYLEGDPDQPIIVGSVYNAEQMPPWALPANMTQSGILSRSTKGGGAANANALRFEDKKGAEQVWLHAEKNQDIEVENDETHWVGHDRKKTIDHDETTLVKHDRTETVDNNETITVHGQRTETVDKDETITIHMNRTETVDLNETITVSGSRNHTVAQNQTTTIGILHNIAVGAAQTVTVGAAQTITVGAIQSVTIGGAQSTNVGGGQTISVAKDIKETAGGGFSQTVAKDHVTKVGGGRSTDVGKDESLKVGKKMVVDVADEITIKTGDASISMKKDGSIKIKGKDILIEGSGKISVKASSDLTLKGSKIGEN